MAEIDEFLNHALADQREMDADPAPQTPTYALLAEGRLEEAEAVARQAVSGLEKENAELGNNLPVAQSKHVARKSKRAAQEDQNSTVESDTRLNLLAEALIAHGLTLARLKEMDAAQVTLERAIAVAQEAGAPDKLGLAALTMIEELEHLTRETLLSAYELASANMAQMGNRKLQWRVIRAAKKVMVSLWGEMDPDRALGILLTRPRSLTEQVLSYESKLIKQALMQTNGGLVEAASLLILPRISPSCLNNDTKACSRRRHVVIVGQEGPSVSISRLP